MNTKLHPDRKSEITLANITESDCAVVALQAVAGLIRIDAVNLAKQYGWQEGVGLSRDAIHLALRAVGIGTKPVAVRYGATVATFALSHEYGVFLIYTKGHVASMVEGDLRNVSKAEWHMPVEEAHQVLPR